MTFQIRLGLKGSTSDTQIESRLIHNPEIFEFYTSEADFSQEGLEHLARAIDKVKSAGVSDIIIHHPMKYKGKFMELVAHPSNNAELVDFINDSTKSLLDIAEEKDCKVLVHGSYEMREDDLMAPFNSLEEAQAYLFSRMDAFWELGKDRIMFENGITPLFSFGDPDFDQELVRRGYPLAYDVSHAFISLSGNNAALQKSLALLKNQTVHYHLVDSMGKTHDSLTLGQGKIDWKAALPFFNEKASSIYEIVLKDQENPQEQLDSHGYLMKISKKALD